MIIKKIELNQFRNFEKVAFTFEKDVHLFYGNNGQGKTNLLEAIYLASMGESFRETLTHDFIQFGKRNAKVKALIQRGDLDFEIEITFENQIKKIALNGKKVSSETLKNMFYAIVFSPENLSNIKGADEERRNLVDELLCIVDKKNYFIIQDYKKMLKLRNKLLKTLKNAERKKEIEDLLVSIQDRFLEKASQLTHLRIEILKETHFLFQEIHSKLIGNNSIEVVWDYRISSEIKENLGQKEIYNAMQERLNNLSQAEKSLGVSLVGPHRQTVKILCNRNDSRFFCSQGQQRMLILAFKFLQFLSYKKKYGYDPLLLLDDVFSELDEKRRGHLITSLEEFEKQIFLTSTENTRLNMKEIKIEKVLV